MNILITNVGRRGYLVDFIKETPGFTGKVYVSDCCKSASGLYSNNDGAFYLPKPSDNEKLYVEKLIELCHTLDVKVVFPVIDPEIDILSKYVDEIKTKGVNVVVSSRDVLNVCWSKLSMNEFLKNNNFNVPNTYTDLESFNKDIKKGSVSFPVMVKPVFGSGSSETYKVSSLEQLNGLFHKGLMIQQMINGYEYGCDVLNNLEKEPVRCVVKRKLAMRSGETDKAVTVKNEVIQSEAVRLAKALGHIGNLDCDVMVENGKLYFIDLNPRFGGGYPISHSAGVNYPDLILRMINGEKIEPEFDNYEYNVLVMKTVAIRKIQITEDLRDYL